jgi:guanosine-3',5'-bis(diphosphate) 3'-pyrophosphohydrolase
MTDEQNLIIKEAVQRINRAFQEYRLELQTNEETQHPKMEEIYNKLTKALVKAYVKGEGMTEENLLYILRAIRFAARKHQFQTRKDAEATPYLAHPLKVAYQLFTIGKVRDVEILISAILHDTLEDTETTLEELIQLFSLRIASIVSDVTDNKSLAKQERKQLQILKAPLKSAGAAQITLADKFCNLSDLIHSPPANWDDQRIEAYFLWAKQVVDRLPWVNAPLKKAVVELLNKVDSCTIS